MSNLSKELDYTTSPHSLEAVVGHWQKHIEGLNAGKEVPHHVMYAENRRIAAAANRYGGYIVVGARHHDIMMQMQMMAIGYEKLWEFAGGRDNEEQGFIDQWGIFLTRKEAWVVAEAAGQIRTYEFGHGTLFSENYL